MSRKTHEKQHHTCVQKNRPGNTSGNGTGNGKLKDNKHSNPAGQRGATLPIACIITIQLLTSQRRLLGSAPCTEAHTRNPWRDMGKSTQSCKSEHVYRSTGRRCNKKTTRWCVSHRNGCVLPTNIAHCHSSVGFEAFSAFGVVFSAFFGALQRFPVFLHVSAWVCLKSRNNGRCKRVHAWRRNYCDGQIDRHAGLDFVQDFVYMPGTSNGTHTEQSVQTRSVHTRKQQHIRAKKHHHHIIISWGTWCRQQRSPKSPNSNKSCTSSWSNSAGSNARNKRPCASKNNYITG